MAQPNVPSPHPRYDNHFRLLCVATWFSIAPRLPYLLLVEAGLSFQSLVAAGALCGALYPDRLLVKRVLSASYLLGFYLALPEAPNHAHILAFMFCHALGATFLPATRRDKVTLAFLRHQLTWVYFFATLWKLNATFLWSDASCGRLFFAEMLPPFAARAVPDTLLQTVPHIVVLTEGALCTALAVSRRLSPRWVAAALVFHAVLAFDSDRYFMNFSATMAAAWLAMLPGDAQKTLWHWLRGARRSRLGVMGACSVLLALPFAVRPANPWDVIHASYTLGGYLLFGGISWVALRASRSPSQAERASSRWTWCVVALVVLNGLSPLIGFKTRTSFNMYSNLQITETDSNHYLLPRSLDALGFIADRMIVLKAPCDALDPLQEGGAEWPRLEIERVARKCRGEAQVRLRSGNAQSLAVGQHGSPWAAAFTRPLAFRPVKGDPARACQW